MAKKTHTRPSPHAPVDPQLSPEVLSWLSELGWPSRTATDAVGTPVLVWLIEQSAPHPDEDENYERLKAPLSDWEIAPLVEELIATLGSVNTLSCRGELPLSAASHSPLLTRLLLASGAQVHSERPAKNPLFSALLKGNREVVDILIEAGADIHLPGSMLHAVQSCSPEMVHFLLDKGISPDQLCPSGNHSLSQVSFNFHKDTIKVLLDAGADLKTIIEGDSILTRALYTDASMEMIERLIQGGAPVCHQKESSKRPLMITAAIFMPLALPLLLASGASVFEENSEEDVLSALGCSILNRYFDDMDASKNALMEVFQQMLDAGAPRERLKDFLQKRLASDLLYDSEPSPELEELRSYVLAWEMKHALPTSTARPRARHRF